MSLSHVKHGENNVLVALRLTMSLMSEQASGNKLSLYSGSKNNSFLALSY